jgi:cytochrome c oxidase subunit 2
MKRIRIVQHIATLAAAAALFAAAPGAAFAKWNLPPPQSPIAQEIYDLHTLIMWIIVVIFVLVFGFMAVAIVKHRKSVGHQAEQFHENTTVEIAWTIVPFVILLGMAYPATKTILAMRDTSNPDITIKATGYQWKWGYDYAKARASASTARSPRRRTRSTARPPRASITSSKWTTTSWCRWARRCASSPRPTT